ncbi:hypothetical protein SMKI_16G1880 [Saccharomyces mikatae IFO 1815]|uniref:C2H2-type domain-containing protein n=1 Tax=Saccharomyces mikatae IFO 1815 TaxID=226126 RepID=A0AA35IVY9_SACMI|nr:uncharacterized protein SMKI_16G1880 [Saccharomyces mikatae IFO 1815]CAI4036891.1 hypothetical protein SMKI_16G1880 [Saccharomyces mikatae IFO 1815]
MHSKELAGRLRKRETENDLAPNSISSPAERFRCPHPECNKTFSRQEHLSRHKLNHWPKEIYVCSFVHPTTNAPCNKTFVRKDLLIRHEKRHSKVKNRLTRTNKEQVSTLNQELSKNLPYNPNELPIAVQNGTSTMNSNSVNLPSVTHESKFRPFIQQPQQLQQPQQSQQMQQMQQIQQLQFPQQLRAPLQQPILQQQMHTQQSSPNFPSYDTRIRNNGQNGNQFFNLIFDNRTSANGFEVDASNNNSSSNNQNLNINPNVQQRYQDRTSTNSSYQQPIQSFPQDRQQEQYFQQQKLTEQQQQQQPLPPQNPFTDQLTSSSSGANLSIMQDLFSTNFLNSDPLQSFMQELSEAPQVSIDDTFADKTTVPANEKPFQQDERFQNPPVMFELQQDNVKIPKAQPKFNDNPSTSVKDNLSSQKLNINKLKRRSSKDLGVESNFSLNYKEQLRHSMKSVPSFFHPHPLTKYKISKEKCQELFAFVPELRYVSIESIHKSLKSFWLNFHPQYGLIHKPSFHVDKQPAILNLALIMTGASFLGSEYREQISDPICGPLRWIIFSHADFQPPSKTYIIQSLLLVEGYEKTSTNRYLHERSFLHHGTTIQLLRRTPSLGGHPLMVKTGTNSGESSIQDPQEVYKRWIDFEMLKRIAFYAFYMDTTHAVVFGYWNLFINSNQIQLTLPCPDQVWESYDLSYETLMEHGYGSTKRDENNTFLSALMQLMKNVIQILRNNNMQRNKGNNDDKGDSSIGFENTTKWNIQSLFGKKILLAGIISILFQCQEEFNGDYFITNFRGGITDHLGLSWKDILSFAMNYWLHEIQKSCTDLKLCRINTPCEEASTERESDQDNGDCENDENLDLLSADNPSNCKIPVIHISQIVLRILHHDYYIYAGAPWRMNVPIGRDEYDMISQRILQFAKDPYNGGVAVIYAFQFLFEMFIIKENNLPTIVENYNVNSDPVITRPYAIALTSLLIWSCNFALHGCEVSIWDNTDDPNEESLQPSDSNSPSTIGSSSNNGATIANNNLKEKNNYIPMESFEVYLLRMYQNLYVDSSLDVVSFQNEIWAKASLLQHISNTHFLCGMMQFMRDTFNKSYWDLGREFGKLFDNCLERSLGKTSPTCHNMFDV